MRVRMQEWGTGFDRLAGRIREMLQEMRGPSYFCSHTRRSWEPRVNLHECARHVIICIDLAGISPDEVELRIEGGTLQIEGSRSRPIIPHELADEVSREEVTVHMMEIDSGRFCRGVPLPAEVHPEKTLASYRQGFLWIMAEKRFTAK